MPADYRDDLAYVHHIGFGDFAEGATPGLLAALRRAGIRSGRVVDLGCGSGRWLRALGDAGYEAHGIEPSAPMLAIARRIAPHAALRRGSAYDVPLPPCAAVTALGEVLSYVPARGAAPSLPRLLARIARALEPGGLLVFDVLVTGRPPLATRAGRSGDDWAVIAETRETPGGTRLARDIVVFRRVRGRWRRSQERHHQRLLSPDEVAAWLARAGFTSIRTSRRYGGHPLAPRRLAFLARTPG